jgi:hypothetical protein
MITGKQVLADKDLWKRLKDCHFHKMTDDERIEFQGRVVKVLSPNTLLVVYYDWLAGAEDESEHVVTTLEMESYRFYESNAEMKRVAAMEDNRDAAESRAELSLVS